MKIWTYRGLVYLAGVPGPDDVQFSRVIYGQVSSVASYHRGHRRWSLPLCRDVLEGLRKIGAQLPPTLVDWEKEQDRLVVWRQEANKFKAMSAREVRERLTAIGVRFKEIDDGHKLMSHQIIAIAYALRLPACGLFLDTGTGKTAVAAAVMQALVDLKGYNRFLVVAPKTILDLGWHDDLRDFSWLKFVNISNPPARKAVTVCPVCSQQFKARVPWAHMRKHMDNFVAKHGEEAAKVALYHKHPELLPPGQEKVAVTTCPICHQPTQGHVNWAHLKTHARFTDKKSELAARRNMYARYPELKSLGSDAKKKRLLRALADPDYQVFLINPEAFKLVIDDLREQDWDMVIVDESSMLKSPRSDITGKMISFAGRVRRRVCMTATPRPNGSLDLWGQAAFIDYCLGGSFTKFREEWFYLGYDGYTWNPKDPLVDHKIWDIMAERSYRVKLEDCIDLPGETIERVGVNLEGKLLQHYQEMLNHMSTTIDNGDVVETSWDIVQLNKLAQITSGYIFDNDGVAQFLEDSPKIQATVDMAKRLIESEDRFVVIWVRFPETEGDRIQEELSKYGVSTLHGHTRNAEASVRAFTEKRNRVMIAHTQSAKFGHTWVNSNVAIFHSYDYSWENFYQAKRRIYRKGQTSAVTYLVTVALGTVDEEILERVFKKERDSDAVVDEGIFATLQRRVKQRSQS